MNLSGSIYGHCIGDALGVPVEFKSRSWLKNNPVSDYLGYMTWNQPPGTFSDDSSMMLCTMESLCKGFDLNDMAHTFVRWYQQGYWGAHDKLFDIGGATSESLTRVIRGVSAEVSGGMSPDSNGNGSLMRILPLIFYLKKQPDVDARYDMVRAVSAITHGHFRSVFACFIFVEYGLLVLSGHNLQSAYDVMCTQVKSYAKAKGFNTEEVELFGHILDGHLPGLPEGSLNSGGYVLHSLESALWCLLNTSDYPSAVLHAVNLGDDTDTTAAITGGLAGLYYGIEDIPKHWIDKLAKTNQIKDLIGRFEQVI